MTHNRKPAAHLRPVASAPSRPAADPAIGSTQRAAPARSEAQADPAHPVGSYNVAMVAALWGVSDTFVYDEIKSGRLKAFKLGNKLLRIKPEWVEEYERAATLDAAPAEAPPPNVAQLQSQAIRAAVTTLRLSKLAQRGRG